MMVKTRSEFDWPPIGKKLQQEKKADLIQLIQELTAVSPEAQRYLQTRYLKKQQIADRIAPYLEVIQAQFEISQWRNTVSWNFAGVQKALDDYAKSSRRDEEGLAALFVVSLETALTFADSINMQDDDFDVGVSELAEKCVDHFDEYPQLLSPYVSRLKKICNIGNALGYYAMAEFLEELVYPHN